MAKPPERSPDQSRWGQWIDYVSGLFVSNLTVSENLAQCWLPVTVVVGQEYPLQALPKLNGRVPYGVSVERVQVISGTGVTGATWVHWEPTSLNSKPALRLLGVYGLAAGTKATLTLLVKAE